MNLIEALRLYEQDTGSLILRYQTIDTQRPEDPKEARSIMDKKEIVLRILSVRDEKEAKRFVEEKTKEMDEAGRQ